MTMIQSIHTTSNSDTTKPCKNCGNPILPVERFTEARLDYCMEHDCIRKCSERVNGVAVVMVHKQGFNLIPISEAVGQNFMDSHGRIE